jgi:ribosome-associated toxin RatA of RatAB toxin-antitoxin module
VITVSRQALVPYRAREMYALVADVQMYPCFLPWCSAVEVAVNEPTRTVATLHIDYRGVRQQFTTENANRPGELIEMRLVRGPFASLHGQWRFAALGDAGCRVEFDIAYELAGAVLGRLVGPVFNQIATTFVDAFVRRADALHRQS